MWYFLMPQRYWGLLAGRFLNNATIRCFCATYGCMAATIGGKDANQLGS
ncbi:MAG: hypothetical protein J0M29_09950 [Chitinophagales bacterium]|nr:hypothetical protein [Chitinophagales bacterium]